MKQKITLFFSLLLAIAGCKEDFQVDTQSKPQLVGNVLTLTVAMPDGDEIAGNMEPRLSAVKDNLNIKLGWEEGDQLQLCLAYNGKKEKQVVDLINISPDGKTAQFKTVLPEGDYTKFDLHGVFGAELDNSDFAKATLPQPLSLLGSDNLDDLLVLTFSATDISRVNPMPSISLENIGSLFNVQLKNSGNEEMKNIKSIELGADKAIGYHAYSGAAQYDIITGELSGTDTSSKTLLFSLSNPVNIPVDEYQEFWVWTIPQPGVNWPALKLNVIDTGNNVVATTSTSKDPRTAPTPAGKAFYMYAAWNGTKLEFTDNSFVINWKEERRASLRGTKATFAVVPRLENGRADINTLEEQLLDLHANTYCWLVSKHENDWDDFQSFLPIAKQHGIKIWVGLLTPVQLPPTIPENIMAPYWTDYEKWVEEIAKLSVQYPNIVAWTLDDFYGKALETFTPAYMQKLANIAHGINPRLGFVPTVYYNRSKVLGFIETYEKFFDGILFPYKAESSGTHNLVDTEYFPSEIADMRASLTEELPIILDIYSQGHSTAGQSTPLYVRNMLKLGEEHADGIMIYTHPDVRLARYRDKYNEIKKAFSGKPVDIPATSYRLSANKLTLEEWLGSETIVDMSQDSQLKNVTRIEKHVFNRTSVLSVTLNDKMSSVGANPFFYAQSLVEILVPVSNPSFTSIDGALYSKDGTILYSFPYARYIEINELHPGVEIIEEQAIANINPLVSIAFPESVREIKLRGVSNSSALTHVKLGKNIKKMNRAFMSCLNIKEIICEAPTPPEIDEYNWGYLLGDAGFYDNCTLYVPEGSIGLYANPATGGYWSKFKHIKEIEDYFGDGGDLPVFGGGLY